MQSTRFHTSNAMLCKPLEVLAVNSLAKKVSVNPFWWNAIQKKITTINTRISATTRRVVSPAGRVSQQP